ncbi:troponin C, slow skeletal and cardiac muscles-like [Ruditapes philippinarum]|uniref:troponin C, slow skeletal and cardiac muscles-like n=1 Tax=Ruditapes philippinarum TaxID=129788 RepID=UPI00295B3A24|nr:troponin C, slow skeletal and cardiac muscles-like [Ruditapes philippinarum]
MANYDEKEWREKFENFDRNKDGGVSANELERLLQYVGFNPTQEDLAEYMKQLDKNSDDCITFDEFFPFLKSLKDPSGELLDAFRLHDKNGDGFIDEKELKAIFTSGNFNPNEIDDLFKLVDANNDGKIEYKEFVELFTEMM